MTLFAHLGRTPEPTGMDLCREWLKFLDTLPPNQIDRACNLFIGALANEVEPERWRKCIEWTKELLKESQR